MIYTNILICLKNTPPAFIFTTANDKIVPCKNSLLLALAYEKQDVPFSLHVFTKGNHGLSVGDETILLDSEIEELKGTYSVDFKYWVVMAINFLKDIGFKRLEKSKE